MIKIMVVDDEAIFREYLKSTIDWASYGFTIVCEARNGLEALEQAELHVPDIALIDINMPYMDGLELAGKLKEKDRDMGIVLITGHSEFEYARKAVRIGVDDYITKPFAKEELILTLLKLQEHILQAQGARSTVKTQQELFKEQLLVRLLSSEYGARVEPTREQLAYAGMQPYSGRFKTAVIEIDNMDQRWDEVGERHLWRFAVSNVLGDIVESPGNHWTVLGPEGRIVSVVEFADTSSEREFDLAAYDKLCVMVKKYLKFTITVGIGATHTGYAGIQMSYKEALLALQNKFVLGGDRMLEYEKHREAGSNIGFYPTEIQEALLLGLRSHDEAKVQNGLEQVARYIREQRLSLDYAYVIYMGLISLCLSYVTEAGHHIGDVFGEGFAPYNEIRKQETLDDAYRWVNELYAKTVKATSSGRMTRARQIADAAKSYIETSFGNPELGVESVAQHLYINSSYLRSVFKKEAGTTVGDYIVGVRLQKAKELIRTGQIKLADIAEMVGYNDPGYFSKSFKKHFGMTPSEYEHTMRK
ncbi:response regulator [Paenibacillus chartarius]|uniref:Response regulator n=1 Tax=Paenibacillus chartarius TaxID=747481 RepID=A0ABV6DFT3_9BACL